MKTTPIASPHQMQQTGVNPQAQADAKARAIAKLTPQSPVQNQNQVQPEEMSAIRPTGQSDTTVTEETQVPAPATEPEQPVSSQMAILARKERALRAKAQQQEQKFRQMEAELKAKEAELQQKYTQPQFDPNEYIPKSRFKEDPLSVMAEEGLSYEEITNQLINQQPRNPRYEGYISKLESKLATLEAKLASQEKAQTEQQSEARQAAIKQIATDVDRLVKSNATDYELIVKTKAQKDVVELIERTYDEEGWVMSNEEAAELVEKEIEERISKLIEAEKIKKRFAAAPAAPTQTDKQTPNPTKQPQPMKTLTNANSSTRKLSARERAIERAKGYRGEF